MKVSAEQGDRTGDRTGERLQRYARMPQATIRHPLFKYCVKSAMQCRLEAKSSCWHPDLTFWN